MCHRPHDVLVREPVTGCPRSTLREQRDAGAQQNWRNCHLHDIHESCAKKTAGQGAAAEEPDILAVLCPQPSTAATASVEMKVTPPRFPEGCL